MDDFKMTYPLVKDLRIFSWIPQVLGSGFSCLNMNLEAENEGRSYERRMTIQVADRQKL